MDEIQSALKSPAWWFTTVAIALIVNLISSYLRNGTDRAISYIRNRLGNGTQSVALSNEAFMKRLKEDVELRRFMFEAETRARLMSIQLFLGSSFMLFLLAIERTTTSALLPYWARLATSAVSFASLYYSLDRLALATGLERGLLRLERERADDSTKQLAQAEPQQSVPPPPSLL